MKKKILFPFFTAVVLTFVLLTSGLTFASDIEIKEVKVSDSHLESILNEIRKDYPNAVIKSITIEEYLDFQEQNSNIEISNEETSVMSSAAPITYLAIYEIMSDNGYEFVANNSATMPVKGNIEIGTFMVGHGNVWHWLGGERITINHPDYYWEPIPLDLDDDGIVDGWYHYVSLDSDAKIGIGNSAEYKFQAMSFNMPWNLEVDILEIVHE
jgi:hypothetical protein